MKLELQQKLFKKFPKIFIQYTWPISKTCLRWGFECGDGWYQLIECLCNEIENYMYNEKSRAKFEKREPCDHIEATQVKEKFGGLRFYTNHEPDHIDGAIAMTERMSYHICENCGSTNNVTQTKGWVVTLCEKYMGNRKQLKNDSRKK